MKIVIIGGVAVGASVATRLRRLDEKAEIILLERGEYISYATCGLPYYVGDTIKEKGKLTVQTPKSLTERFNLDIRIQNEVLKIDVARKVVYVKDNNQNKEYEESYDKLVIATGADAKMPQIKGYPNGKTYSLKTIEDASHLKEYMLKNSPKTVVIVGGGFVGLEVAENLAKQGIQVSIVEYNSHLLANLDYEMACIVENYLRRQGIRLLLNKKVEEFEEVDDKLKTILSDEEILSDFAFMSAGVLPNSKIAKEAGIEVNERGYIVVNKKMQTSNPDIYAGGDVIEVEHFITKEKATIPMAGPANKQGRIIADNIAGIFSQYEGTQGSSILQLLDKTIATTGITEQQAKKTNISYDKAYITAMSHATYYPGANNMFMKVIFEKQTGLILGAQIVGNDGVDKRMDVLATAIRGHMTAYDLTQLELCYAPPYSQAKDPVNIIGYVIENLLGKKVKQFSWEEVTSIPKDNSVNLIDVRTQKEYESGHVEGFINIPVDELRQKIDTIDKNKKTYLICRSAFRSYIASRILEQNGIQCMHLAGGWILYHEILENERNEEK